LLNNFETRIFMSRLLFTCLTLILTNTVIAQADFVDNGGLSARIQTGSWTALFAGTTELDGMPVLAALEKLDHELTIPNFIIDRTQTLVPLAPAKQPSFRLMLVATNQSNIRVSFPLQLRTVIMNGNPAQSYISESRPGDQFEFAVIPRADGTMLVRYRRATNETANGEFALNPLPQLF
jgi:hypothetical protein